MKLRPLGNSGIHVSPIGLGLVKIGRNQGIAYPNYADNFTLPSDTEVQTLLAVAAEQGVNLLDTAPAYGSSEARLGELLGTQLKQHRDRWVLCSKAGEAFHNNQSHFDFSAEAITASIERSLMRLGTDHLDIALIHSSGDDERILERNQPLATLARLREQGKVRAIGFSGKSLAGGREALAQGAQVLMVTINSEQREELPLLTEAQSLGCGVLIKKALGRGYGDLDELGNTARLTGVSSIVVGTLNPDHLSANVALVEKALATETD